MAVETENIPFDLCTCIEVLLHTIFQIYENITQMLERVLNAVFVKNVPWQYEIIIIIMSLFVIILPLQVQLD